MQMKEEWKKGIDGGRKKGRKKMGREGEREECGEKKGEGHACSVVPKKVVVKLMISPKNLSMTREQPKPFTRLGF